MRNSLLLFSLLCLTVPCAGQDEADSPPPPPRALPVAGAAQDAEASREKLLKAADELDMMQSNSESTRVAVDAMKADITQLQSANADLKQQLASLQAAFDRAEATRTKERQAMVDEVSQLLAARPAAKPAAHKHVDEVAENSLPPSGDPDMSAHVSNTTASEVHHASGSTHLGDPAPATSSETNPEPVAHPQKGYYHKVESGETLTMILAAYRDQGVKVSLAQVRKANGLTSKSVLKVGQKLFIPKPGT